MGVSLDPGLFEYCPWDNSCYPPGLTPYRIFCNVQGLEPTESWVESLGLPPVGVKCLEQIDETVWRWEEGEALIELTMSDEWSLLLILTDAHVFAYHCESVPCSHIFLASEASPNQWFNPADIVLFSRETPPPGNPDPTAVSIAFGLPLDAENFVDVFMNKDHVPCYRFRNKKKDLTIRFEGD